MASKPINKPHIYWSRFWWAGLATIGAAVAANAITRQVLFTFFDAPEDFPPLEPIAVLSLTAVAALLAVIIFAVVALATNEPVRIFRIVSTVVLIMSLIPIVLLALNPSALSIENGTPGRFLTLFIFHLVAYLVCIFLLPALVIASE